MNPIKKAPNLEPSQTPNLAQAINMIAKTAQTGRVLNFDQFMAEECGTDNQSVFTCHAVINLEDGTKVSAPGLAIGGHTCLLSKSIADSGITAEEVWTNRLNYNLLESSFQGRDGSPKTAWKIVPSFTTLEKQLV